MSTLLAKVTPHGKVINGEGFGGAPAVTAVDVAGALGMPAGGERLDNLAWQWGLAKYAFDPTAVRTVKRECIRRVIDANAGRGKSSAWLAGLAVFVLEQQLIPPVCPECNGGGMVAGKSCLRCSGSGRRSVSKRGAAARLGLSESAWRRTWEARTSDLVRAMTDWESAVQAHLHWHFGRR